MLLVDTNVLVDVLEDDPHWADWSVRQLKAQSQVHVLTINPIIYAELSLTFTQSEALDETLEDLGLAVLEMPRPARFIFIGGEGICPLPPCGRTEKQCACGFFHRGACRRAWLPDSDPRCAPVSHLFPDGFTHYAH